jgi:hypothetical protein
LKARFDVESVDASRDSFMEDIIEAASRWIDQYTGRVFYATSEARYFTAESSVMVRITDLLSVTTLKTDDDGDRTYETTWASTDYDLMPYNDVPYQWIEAAPNGVNLFTGMRRGVEINGSWGYASTAPHAVREACLLYAARLYKRKDAVLGVAGPSAMGQIVVPVPSDKDVERLLSSFVRVTL